MTRTTSITEAFTHRGLITPPTHVIESVAYETEVGSVSYGVSTSRSDIDICGFCVPPPEVVFGHLRGEVPGFGRHKQHFNQYQQHHIDDGEGTEWDLTIYAIPRYFHLCMEGNPNMLESLFTPLECVQWATPIAKRIRAARQRFLHKGAWFKFKGFAHSQIHKMNNRDPQGSRVALIEEFGYDVKYAYHAVRLMDEAEQIMTTGDLDLMASQDRLKAIRRGAWSQAKVNAYVEEKEQMLDEVYESSDVLPHSPDEDAIRELLLECLQETWGSLEGIVAR